MGNNTIFLECMKFAEMASLLSSDRLPAGGSWDF